jgi:hypothetical protein
MVPRITIMAGTVNEGSVGSAFGVVAPAIEVPA